MFKDFIICFFTLLSFAATAQKNNTWRGGAPGHETDWNYAKNWSLNKTPDAFDKAIIPDVSTTTRCYPVIASGQVEVWSLEIQAEAALTLHKSAVVLAETFENYGTCKGCSSRVLLENTDSVATAQR